MTWIGVPEHCGDGVNALGTSWLIWSNLGRMATRGICGGWRLEAHTHWATHDHADCIFDRSPVVMRHWNVHV